MGTGALAGAAAVVGARLVIGGAGVALRFSPQPPSLDLVWLLQAVTTVNGTR